MRVWLLNIPRNRLMNPELYLRLKHTYCGHFLKLRRGFEEEDGPEEVEITGR